LRPAALLYLAFLVRRRFCLREDRGFHLHLLNRYSSLRGRGARNLRLGSVLLALLVVSLGLSACGKNFYFAGRSLPPSGILNRVLIAVQNSGTGQLFLVDAYYDIRHSYNNVTPDFPISGFTGYPSTIQNLPAERTGLVFSLSTGTMSAVNYATETATALPAATASGEIPSSIFDANNLTYSISAQQQNHFVEMYDGTTNPTQFALTLPGVYKVSINPAGTVALAFLQNYVQGSTAAPYDTPVYSIVHLTNAQQLDAAAHPDPTTGARHYKGAEDCEPQNLPQYCVFPVNVPKGVPSFDHPVKAVFSPDGSSAFIVNCGPECGGTTAGLTQIPLTSTSFNAGAAGPAGIALTGTKFLPVPGGATNALFDGDTLYVAGQQLVAADNLFTGELTAVNTETGAVGTPVPISDGTHGRMVLADDNTLWVGSTNCQGGERYKQAQAGQNTPYGCMTMYNTSTGTVTAIESYKGDGTGIAAVSGLDKVYTAEGGQVYIYNTKTGAAIDNTNVTENGDVVDVAYMDAPDDSDNSWY
jgi:hypothetical protein